MKKKYSKIVDKITKELIDMNDQEFEEIIKTNQNGEFALIFNDIIDFLEFDFDIPINVISTDCNFKLDETDYGDTKLPELESNIKSSIIGKNICQTALAA